MAERVTAEERAQRILVQLASLGYSFQDAKAMLVSEIEAAQAQARREGLEAACRAVCEHCRNEVPLEYNPTRGEEWHAPDERQRWPCHAAPIRALLVAEGGEGNE